MTTTDEQILWESEFQIISEKELVELQNQKDKTENHKSENNDIKKILKETGIYDELDDEEIKKQIDLL